MRPRPTFPRLLGTCLLTCVVAMLCERSGGVGRRDPQRRRRKPAVHRRDRARRSAGARSAPIPATTSIAYEGDLSGAAFSTDGHVHRCHPRVPGDLHLPGPRGRNRLPQPAPAGDRGLRSRHDRRRSHSADDFVSPSRRRLPTATTAGTPRSRSTGPAPTTAPRRPRAPRAGDTRTQGANQTRSGAATNAAGLTSPPVTTPIFNFDRRPRPGR